LPPLHEALSLVRSPREIAFRLHQEFVNAWRLVHAPRLRLREPFTPAAALSDPAACARFVRDTPYAAELIAIARDALEHRFPLFGQTIQTGSEIDWRRDYKHEKTSGTAYFRRVPYLDFDAVGDHKWIWELNRHQYLVALAQAFLITSQPEYPREIERQIESWVAANPFVRGINWASALEVAFRALSWIWIDHLIGDRLKGTTRIALQKTLWLHARHLETNLSVYFSPNTHLLGEALALYAIGRMYPRMPGARRFLRIGGRVIEQQLDFQIKPDGSHFEQSTYYHAYALDMFLLYYVLAGRPSHINAKLLQMARYLDALAGHSRRLFSSGDDDGGRLFHPFGERDRFCRATLATCANLFPELGFEYCSKDVYEQAAWWLGPGATLSASRSSPRTESNAFADSGVVVLHSGAVQLLFDAGPFGRGGAGHSHADTLNILVRRGEDTLLADSGTFSYVSDAAARNWFRGTAAHNTIRIDGKDQADPVKPFRWENKPAVRLNRSGESFADAQCEYRGFVHRRRVLLCADRACIVVDDLHGPEGDHTIEQFWNTDNGASLITSEPHEYENAWRSDTYGSRVEVQRPVVRLRSRLPRQLAAVLITDGSSAAVRIESGDPCIVHIAGVIATFPEHAAPFWRSE
jgi:hypothetical protein